MDLLPQIISNLRKEEIRHFKLFAGRVRKGDDRKDLRLFEMFKRSPGGEEKEGFAESLYGKGSRNPYYRLKNRLLETLNESLWLLHYRKDPFSSCMYLFSLARLHEADDRNEVALYYLRRAERQASKEEYFELLDLIYRQFIRLSSLTSGIDPEAYIRLRKENRAKLEALNAIDDLLAVVTHRIYISLNYGRIDMEILDLLQKTVAEYEQDQHLTGVPRVRFRIYEAVSRILIQKQEYVALEAFLKKTYPEFANEGLFTRQNHQEKLQMLTYLVNALFANGKYAESLAFTGQLREAMLEYNEFLSDAYAFYYYNALVLNYSILDEKKALDTLLKLRDDKSLKGKAYNRISIFINLSVLYFNKGDFRKALRSLIELGLLDDFRNADKQLKLKVVIFELIVRFRMNENELLGSRIPQVEKDFSDVLSTEPSARDSAFIHLLKEMNRAAFEIRPNQNLLDRMKEFLDLEKDSLQEERKPIYSYEALVSEKLAEFQSPQSA
jgi:hypothetical protein